MRDIRNVLDGIHLRSFKGLKVFQKVPCICTECGETGNRFMHDYNRLQQWREENTTTTSQCGNSGMPVSIQELLEGVDSKDRDMPGMRYGDDKEIRGLKKALNLSIRKQNLLLEEKTLSNDPLRKMKIEEDLKTVEEEIAEFRKKLRDLQS